MSHTTNKHDNTRFSPNHIETKMHTGDVLKFFAGHGVMVNKIMISMMQFAGHAIRRAIDDGQVVRVDDAANKALDKRLELAENALLEAGYVRVDAEGNWRKDDVVDAEFDPDFQEVKGPDESPLKAMERLAKHYADKSEALEQKLNVQYELASRSCRSLCEYLGKSRDDVSFDVIQAIILLERSK